MFGVLGLETSDEKKTRLENPCIILVNRCCYLKPNQLMMPKLSGVCMHDENA